MRHSTSNYLPVILSIDDAAELPRLIPESELDTAILWQLYRDAVPYTPATFSPAYTYINDGLGLKSPTENRKMHAAWFTPKSEAEWVDGVIEGYLCIGHNAIGLEDDIHGYDHVQQLARASDQHGAAHYPARFWFEHNVYGNADGRETIRLVWEINLPDWTNGETQSNYLPYGPVLHKRLEIGEEPFPGPKSLGWLLKK